MCVYTCLEEESLRTRFCAINILQLMLFSLPTLFSPVKSAGRGEERESQTKKADSPCSFGSASTPLVFSLSLSHPHARTQVSHPSTQVGMWSRTKGRLQHNRKKECNGTARSRSREISLDVFVCHDHSFCVPRSLSQC